MFTQTDERQERKARFVEKAHADTQTEDLAAERVIQIPAVFKTKKTTPSSRKRSPASSSSYSPSFRNTINGKSRVATFVVAPAKIKIKPA